MRFDKKKCDETAEKSMRKQKKKKEECHLMAKQSKNLF
jgi:hypothetical protein